MIEVGATFTARITCMCMVDAYVPLADCDMDLQTEPWNTYLVKKSKGYIDDPKVIVLRV